MDRAKSKVHSTAVRVHFGDSVRDDSWFFRVREATRGRRRHSTWYQLTVLRPPMPQRGRRGRHRCSRPWNLNTNIISCFRLNVTKSSNTSPSPSFTFGTGGGIPFVGDFFSSFTLLCAAEVFEPVGPGCDVTGSTAS